MKTNVLLLAGVIASASAIIIWYIWKNRRDHFLATESVATLPEVEYIQGEPDSHLINDDDNSEVVRPHDIALGEGFGVGEGTFGFGRFGSSFMA